MGQLGKLSFVVVFSVLLLTTSTGATDDSKTDKSEQPPQCVPNATYTDCGPACVVTCEEPDVMYKCIEKCVPGCFCDDGFLVENKTGLCIPREECQCKEGRSYSSCGSACPKTCKNRNEDIPCIEICVPGCFCKEGLFENENNGRCVTEEACKVIEGECIGNQIPSSCASRCPRTCQNRDDDGIFCTADCVQGCVCEEGLIWDEDVSLCVKVEDCSKGNSCPSNQVPSSCASRCPRTCQNKDDGIMCPAVCVEGCTCKPGLIWDEWSEYCVKETDCPKCQENAKYSGCGSYCAPSCQNRNQVDVECPGVCVQGCFCVEPYILEESTGKCVLESDCPVETTLAPITTSERPKCKENQSYKECGPACVKTCQKADIQIACIDMCVSGCFCDDGYLLDEETGQCVKEEICKCNENEKYTSCGSACPASCQNQDEVVACPAICVPGCFCEKGYIRDEFTKRCVNESSCICEENEEYQVCGNHCAETCQSPAPQICTAICKIGCFCREGFLEDEKSGLCYPKDVCKCGPNSTFNNCGSSCPRTCQNLEKPEACITACNVGCFCDAGFLWDEVREQCVPEESCLCQENAHYASCGNSCPLTCQNRNKVRACPISNECKPECVCDEGFLLDEVTKKCVRENECPVDDDCETTSVQPVPQKCPKANQVLVECGNTCPLTCQNRDEVRTCPVSTECRPECVCANGLLLNEETGECVRDEDCPCDDSTTASTTVKPTTKIPPKCPKPNQVYEECSNFCPLTCQNKNEVRDCPIPIVCKGECVCAPGYLLDEKSKRCVKERDCPRNEITTTSAPPPKCSKPNQSYNECGSACVVTCQDPDRVYKCTFNCVPGCYCNDGFLLDNSTGECVPENLCRCQDNAKYESCGSSSCPLTCQNRGTVRQCDDLCQPGCVCQNGYLLNEIDGRCVKEEECPLESCSSNEVWTECGKACPRTCQNKDDVGAICQALCVPGCSCKQGYVLDETTNQCIPEASCNCNENEEYKSCGTMCEPNCQDPPPLVCPLACVSGCFCKSGYIRDKESGLCIPEGLCKCQANATFTNCGSYCPRTCQNPEPPEVCPEVCKIGCVCDQGFLLDEDTGECRSEQECCCGENAEWNNCGSACPEKCPKKGEEEVNFCTLQCVQGCFCKEGFVYDDSCGKCVRKEDCPEV